MDVIKASLEELRKTTQSAQAEKFFPNGVELIFIKVAISGIAVELTVAGPKAQASWLSQPARVLRQWFRTSNLNARMPIPAL